MEKLKTNKKVLLRVLQLPLWPVITIQLLRLKHYHSRSVQICQGACTEDNTELRDPPQEAQVLCTSLRLGLLRNYNTFNIVKTNINSHH